MVENNDLFAGAASANKKDLAASAGSSDFLAAQQNIHARTLISFPLRSLHLISSRFAACSSVSASGALAVLEPLRIDRGATGPSAEAGDAARFSHRDKGGAHLGRLWPKVRSQKSEGLEVQSPKLHLSPRWATPSDFWASQTVRFGLFAPIRGSQTCQKSKVKSPEVPFGRPVEWPLGHAPVSAGGLI